MKESHTFIPPCMIDLLTLHTMRIRMDRCWVNALIRATVQLD
ncbi:hypothetical protein HMPREF0083_04255 [Aneurinibacillus aneurinilyticus ATCC 12856]|uniref:Uncharacterized protein n=1 Tax=Aneurinibacillus aneurinilyticus ATCC 12856 TaxID=649747 RepID=U1Y683_ANEAE|nr:hypothetical protein HMPREF0083_04255 [Aneurinibacillus aneurinilyticus ATCC 12856]